MAKGSSGPLSGFAPFRNSSLWRAVATGFDPELQEEADAQALWERFAAAGRSAFALGWPDSPLPSDLAADLAELSLGPAEVDPGLLALLIPRIREIDLSADPLPGRLLSLLAELYSVHNQAAALLAERQPEFLAVRLNFLEQLHQLSGMDAECYRAVIPHAYRMLDALLGDLLRSCPSGTDVMLVSVVDAKLVSGSTQGFWAAAGPSFQAGATLLGGRVVDVAPTILAAAGWGADPRCCGRALSEALVAGPAETASAPLQPAVRSGPGLPRADWAIGVGLLDLGAAPRALGYLQLCFLSEPENPQFAYDYARCLQQLGLLSQALEPAAALLDHGSERPSLALMQAQLAVTEGRYADALPLARSAIPDPTLQRDAAKLEGLALLGLRRFAELAPLVEQTLATEPDHALAWAGRAHLLFVQQDWAGATVAAKRALQLQPSLPLPEAILRRISGETGPADRTPPAWSELTRRAARRKQWAGQIAERERAAGLMTQSGAWQVRPPHPREQARIARYLRPSAGTAGTPDTPAVIAAGKLPRLVGLAVLHSRPDGAALLEFLIRPTWQSSAAAAELIGLACQAARGRRAASVEVESDHSSPLFPLLLAAGFTPKTDLEIYHASIAAGLAVTAPFLARLKHSPISITGVAAEHLPVIRRLCHELGLLDPSRVVLSTDPAGRNGIDPRFSFLAGTVEEPDGIILCRVVAAQFYLEVLAKNPRSRSPFTAAALMQAALAAGAAAGLTEIFCTVTLQGRPHPAALLFRRAAGYSVRKRSLLALSPGSAEGDA